MNYKDFRALFKKRFSLPRERSIREILRSFTIAEKAVLFCLIAIFIISGLTLLWKVGNLFMIEIPIQGGTLSEGVVGNPRFINPVLAISDADKNLTSLVYSGLVRITPEGKIINDLAREIKISEDRLTYTATIKDGAQFHDGIEITSDDIIYTIGKISNPTIKSPKKGNWDGVDIERIDERTVSFTLKQPYTPFIYNLTLGILPKHIWKNVTDEEFSFSQFNTLPVGSGPYEVESVERNPGGIPNYYKLSSFKDISGRAPFIKKLIFRFYSNESQLIDAFNKQEVKSLSGLTPEKIPDLKTGDSAVVSSPLPRVFAVFFNQSKSKVLLNKEVRQALDLASPREKIVEKILGGYATAIDGPMPAGIYKWADLSWDRPTAEANLEKAKALLAKAGWHPNPETGVLEKKSGSATISLSFSLSTGDAPELQAVARVLISEWRKLGAKVEVLVYETGDLNQNVIRPRNFDTLLFGEVVSRDTDLFPFWHSSQRTDPGLNIALYANNQADKYLEAARRGSQSDEIEKNYQSFVGEIKKDVPAVFLYTPGFLYIVPKEIKAINLGSLSISQDRFLGIRDWYIDTDKVWSIFVNN